MADTSTPDLPHQCCRGGAHFSHDPMLGATSVSSAAGMYPKR